MTKRNCNWLRLNIGWAVWALLLATPAHADFTVGRNLAFSSPGNNPWAPGPAFEWDPEPFTLLNIPYTHVDIPPLDANPTEAVLGVLGDILGVDIPDIGIASLKVGGSVSGSAYVGADLYATLGKMDVKYPGHADLNVQTNGALNGGVTTRQPYAIGSSFQPGVNVSYNVSPLSLVGVFGPGYNSPQEWAGLSYTTFSQPTFKTTAPWANARLIAEADVHAGVFAQVSAGFGAFKGRLNYKFGGPVGGTIVEIDPSGLYLYGEDTGLFNATEPINIPISGVGTATVRYPDLGIPTSFPDPMNSAVLRGTKVAEVFSIDADIEKLIPVLGPILHNSLGPLTYDLAHIGLKPKVSLYQDLAFVPDPRVRLRFSEMVVVNGNITKEVEYPLGQTLQWTPIFSNSSQIKIVPEYIMKNSFYHVTGLALDVDVTFDALGFDAPFLPGHVGPLIGPTTATLDVARFPLYEPDPWEISVKSIFGNEITIPKFNAVDGLEDVHLTFAQLVGGNANGPATYELHFERSVAGQPHQFQTTVPGIHTTFLLDNPGGGEAFPTHVFAASQDIVFIDPFTNEQFNLGQYFGLGNTDLSGFLPGPSPSLVVEDPAHPGQFLPPLYGPHLDAIPYTPLDVENHPILGFPTLDQTNSVVEVEYNPAIVDQRNEPVTTILVQSIDITPEGDAEFGPLPKALINNSGTIAVQGTLASFSATGGSAVPALYLASEAGNVKLVRAGDPTPGSGTVQLGNSPFNRVDDVSEVGVVTFQANGSDPNQRGVYLGRTDGVALVARHGQSIPSGAGFFYFTDTEIPVAINSVYDVAFATSWSSTPGGNPTGFGVFRGDGNTSLVQIAEVGIDPLGNTGIVTQILDKVDVNDSGDVSFLAQTTLHPNFGVYRGNGQSLVAIALPGGPGPFGSTIQAAFPGLTPKINNSGQVAFAASILTSLASSATAIYRGDGVQLTQIAVAGQFGTAAPDLDGVLSAIQPSIQVELNDAGQVAFMASVAGAANYNAIFRGDGANLKRIARTGQAAPDGDGTFQYLNAPDLQLNSQGHVAFVGDLSNTTHNQGLFVFDGTNVVQVVRIDQSLAGSTVTSFSGPSLNDQMQVAYTAQLADGRQVAARFEPTMYWRNAGSGTWGAGGNWSLRVDPTNPYDVLIVAESALTVTGPAVNRTVKSLSIGGENTASATLDLIGGTTLTVTNLTTILPNGTLSGYGALAADEISNGGTLRVGGSGATPTTIISLAGDVTLEASGKLELDIKGTAPGSQFDQLHVAGQLTLGGTLQVTLVNFNPAAGNSFDLLDGSTIAGTFAALQLPGLGPDLMWHTSQLVTTGVLSVALAGDYNVNGTVDAADYVVWRNGLGSTYSQADYDVWRAHFGQTAGSGVGATVNLPGSAVPEPPTLVFMLAAVGAYLRRRKSQ